MTHSLWLQASHPLGLDLPCEHLPQRVNGMDQDARNRTADPLPELNAITGQQLERMDGWLKLHLGAVSLSDRDG